MFPEIEEMVNKLGTSALRLAKYTLKNIKELMYSQSKEATSATKEAIEKTFKIGETYSLKDTKIELQKIYDNLKMTKKAKAMYVEEYFTIDLKRVGTVNSIIIKKGKS